MWRALKEGGGWRLEEGDCCSSTRYKAWAHILQPLALRIFSYREMWFGEKKALCFFPAISQTSWINILTQQLCDCGWIFQLSELIFSYLQGDNKTCFTGMGESEKVLVTQLCLNLWDPARLLCSWHFPDKNTEVGCHFLLQGIFLTQGLMPHFLHCSQIPYHLSLPGSPSLCVYIHNYEIFTCATNMINVTLQLFHIIILVIPVPTYQVLDL